MSIKYFFNQGVICALVFLAGGFAAFAQSVHIVVKLEPGSVMQYRIAEQSEASENEFLVVNLTERCSAEFGNITQNHIGDYLQIVVGDEVLAEATVMGVMSSGIIQTTPLEPDNMKTLQVALAKLEAVSGNDVTSHNCFLVEESE